MRAFDHIHFQSGNWPCPRIPLIVNRYSNFYSTLFNSIQCKAHAVECQLSCTSLPHLLFLPLVALVPPLIVPFVLLIPPLIPPLVLPSLLPLILPSLLLLILPLLVPLVPLSHTSSGHGHRPSHVPLWRGWGHPWWSPLYSFSAWWGSLGGCGRDIWVCHRR